MGFVLESLLMEDDATFRLESAGRLGLNTQQIRQGPQVARLEQGTASLLALEVADGEGGIIIEGMTAEAAQLTNFDDGSVLPERYAHGASGGPGFHTIVQVTADGTPTIMVPRWSRPRRQYRPGTGMSTTSQQIADPASALEELLSFYRAHHGSLVGFRWRDPFDHATSRTHTGVPDFNNLTHRHVIGAGDGVTTTWQLIKRYRLGCLERIRPITRPDTVVIVLNGAFQLEGVNFSLASDGGEVTFFTPPAAGAVIEWVGNYHVPVRFGEADDAGFRYQMPSPEVAAADLMTLTEIKENVAFSDHKFCGGWSLVTMAAGQLTHAISLNDGFVQTVIPDDAGQTTLRTPMPQQVIDGGPVVVIHNGGSGGQTLRIQTPNAAAPVTVVSALAPGEHAVLYYHSDGTWLAVT